MTPGRRSAATASRRWSPATPRCASGTASTSSPSSDSSISWSRPPGERPARTAGRRSSCSTMPCCDARSGGRRDEPPLAGHRRTDVLRQDGAGRGRRGGAHPGGDHQRGLAAGAPRVARRNLRAASVGAAGGPLPPARPLRPRRDIHDRGLADRGTTQPRAPRPRRDPRRRRRWHRALRHRPRRRLRPCASPARPGPPRRPLRAGGHTRRSRDARRRVAPA